MRAPFWSERVELAKVARLVFTAGLTDTHGGNISMKCGNHILIKKSGRMMATLTPYDFTVVPADGGEDFLASVELKVHRAIYTATERAKVVLHAHPPYTIACSLIYSTVEPVDAEGRLLLRSVPVLKASKTIASEEVAEKIGALIKDSKAVIVQGHGPFVAEESPEGALKLLSALENSCKIILSLCERGKSEPRL